MIYHDDVRRWLSSASKPFEAAPCLVPSVQYRDNDKKRRGFHVMADGCLETIWRKNMSSLVPSSFQSGAGVDTRHG